MDYFSLNGYEFEKYITNLLRHLGFRAQQTSLSGDGGVDIVAYNDEPLTKGLYLIQCKNWSNPVGQPEVRDLFGVVMSQRANKGILITTSYFTEQAIEFANGLNIELIDGKALNELSKTFLQPETNEKIMPQYDDYLNDGCFPKDRYIYLKQKAENTRTYQSYAEYLVFLLQYTEPRYLFLVDKGLGKVIINLCDEIHKQFCKKGKNRIYRAKSIGFIKSYVLFIMGRIANSIESMETIGLLDFDKGMDYYVPCDAMSIDKTALDLFQSNPNSTMMQFYRNGTVISSSVAGDYYFVEMCNCQQVIVLDLLMLVKQLEINNLAAYLQDKITSRGIQKLETRLYPASKSFIIDYCYELILQQKNIGSDTQGLGETHYKWFPYFFSLEKRENDVWIRTKCYKNRAENIEETLLKRWENVEQIKTEITNVVHLLGLM